MKSWLHPWIELYILQVAYSMLVWNFMVTDGSALWSGIVVAAIFAFLAYGFYMKKKSFRLSLTKTKILQSRKPLKAICCCLILLLKSDGFCNNFATLRRILGMKHV